MNKSEYCRLASKLIKKLQQKHEEAAIDIASIEELLVNLGTLREFLWTDKKYIAGFLFDKNDKGSYIRKHLDNIREVFIDKGYDTRPALFFEKTMDKRVGKTLKYACGANRT